MTDRAVPSTPSTRLIGPQSRVGAVPMRLRRFVALDSDLLLAILTATSTLEILTQRATLTSPIGTGIGVDAAPLAALHRLFRSADATDRRVLTTARRLDWADRRT